MAQTKKVTIELGFKSNTQEVKKNLKELSASLHELSNMEIGLKGGDLDLARQAARELTVELQKAVNVDTGRLDLNKLTKNLKSSHKDIVGLSSELLRAGHIGQQSFLQIAQAIGQAEIPTLKLNRGIKDFMDNLAKTAKWQIAQTAIQTVQGSLQNAVREAELLNKALNDIRIVTGLDQNAMANFAKEANKAAKELKTTTKEYAEASLIFYQQGLGADEVAKRAETVIKMSQVTGDSAKAVSDQMTAIWNNFDNGSKSLEYYADAMAKLGAETAASTSEIATGLEKFAAIAETVGLSYETAMASVATVIDKTRQSADVVGTAFKTIFARVQGLSMDGVTDDGVTLNKYSKALEKVGVDVLTASGELRDMDEILNDLGAKWQGLGRESQVAVAQVVGGARQYNQLLSLMDNWSEVQSNILKAEGSTGEISKQANIWADSYEAAANRVEEAKARASENFLNSDDVVNLTNMFADLIEYVDHFIDRMGGIGPILLTITALFSSKLLPILKTGFNSFIDNIFTLFGGAEARMQKTQKLLASYLDGLTNIDDYSDAVKKQLELNKELILVKQAMAEAVKHMSDQERESALATLDIYEKTVLAAIEANRKMEEADQKSKQAQGKFSRTDLVNQARTNDTDSFFTAYESTTFEGREIKTKFSEEEKREIIKKASKTDLEADQKKEEKNRHALEEEIKQMEASESADPDVLKQKKAQLVQMEEERAIRVAALNLQKYQANSSTTMPPDKRKISIGTVDTSSILPPEQIADKGVREKYAKIKENLLSNENLTFAGDDGQKTNLEITIANYQALRREATEYEVQLTRIDNITSELSTRSQELEAANEEKKQAQSILNDPNSSEEEKAKAQKALSAATEKAEKIQKNYNNTAQKSVKILKNNEQRLITLAKKLGLTDDEVAALEESFSKLDENDAKSIEAIESQLLDLSYAAGLGKNEIMTLAQEIETSLGEVDAKAMEEVKQQEDEYQESAVQTAQANDRASDSFAGLKTSLPKADFEQIATATLSVIGGFSALTSGVTSLIDAFDSGNTPMETFMGILSGMGTILPVIIGLYQTLSKAELDNVKSVFKNIAAKKAEEVQDKKGLPAKIASVTAKVAEWIASLNPVGIAMGAIALGLIGAVAVAGISKAQANKKEQQREENTANIEAAQKSNEVASAVQTESQAIDELIGQYNKLSDSEKASSELKDDIINQVDKVIEKYQEYANSVNMATDAEQNLKSAIQELEIAQTLGNIEGIKKAQEKADLIIAKEAKDKNDLGITGTLGNIGLKEDAKQVKAKDGYIQRQVGGAGNEEIEANKILQAAMKGSVVKTRDRGTRIKLRTDSAEHFIEDYDKLQTAVDNMYKSSDSRVKDPNINNTLYECLELLSTYQEEYNSLKNQIASGAVHSAQIAMGNVGKSVSDIKSYTDYVNYKTSVQKNIDENNELTDKGKEQAKESLNSQLSMNSELKVFAELEKKLDIIAEKGTQTRANLEALFDEIDAEIAVNINYSIYNTEEDIADEAQRQINEKARKEAQADIKAYSEIGELLKPEGMTEEDWTKIAESDLFKDNPKAFQDFMNQSYGSQIAQLSKDKRTQIQADINLLKENIESYKQTLKTTNSAETWDAAKAALETAQQELAIKLKVQEAQEKYIKELRASDIVDIYHDINKSLSELERQYKKIQQIQNDTFGDSAISLYDDLINNIDKQNEKIQDRIDLNREEALFKQNQFVQKHQDNFGMAFEFDSDGNLLNYNQLTEKLLARGHNGEEIEILLEEWKNDYAEYSEYVDAIYNDLDKIEENERYKKELNFKKITATVDLTIEINDMKLKQYEYEINKSLKDISTSADALDSYNNQLTDITTLTKQYSTEVKELENAYKAGDITKADYVAGLQETYNETFNNLQVLEELKQTVMNFYGEQLNKAAEEIDKYTSKMKSATSALDHYQTLLGLINETSGESMRAVVNAQTATSKSIFEASKNEYAFYKDQADGARAKLANFVGDKKSDAYKEIENEVKAAEEKEKESLDRMYSSAAEWAEDIRAKVEFELTEAAKTVEKEYLESFKDIEGNIQFSSYDEVLAAMERKSLLQEDFLTSTNKTYELNKMINQLERDALKTDNVRAKQKLESFKTELKNLQQSGKLSKAELDIKQKEYELTLAEIALEEAQNAKSVVRLTRTADGGFGYIYTADENATAEAEQNRADAENALYNAKLETQNNYTQKSIQAQAQFHQEMEELTQQYINGEIESQEEFDRRKQDLWEYYSELIAGYSDILNRTLIEDSNQAKDVWSKDFQSMTIDISNWTNSITGEEGYFAKIQSALTTWAADLSFFKSSVGLDFTNITENVGNITTKVGELTTALGDKDKGVIKGLQGFMAEVNTWLTGNASTFLSNISNLATTFEKLAKEILNTVSAAKTADDLDLSGDNNNSKTIGTEKDGYKAAGQSEWKAAYTAALNGTEYKSEHKFSDTDSEEFKTGYQNSINDAIALGTAHRNAGEGLTGTEYTAGAIYSGDNNTLSHEAAKQINESYYANLVKARKGEQVDTNFISVDSRPEDKQEEKGLGTYGVLAAFIQGTLGDYYGQKAKEVFDQNFNSLDVKTQKAFQALGKQYLSERNRDEIESILSKMIDEEFFDIPALKKALSFNIAKDYMDTDDEVTVSYADWNAWDLATNGDPYYNFGHSKTYKVKELVNDKYVEPVPNGEIRWAYEDNGIQTLRRYIISNKQIADLISAFDTGGYTGSWGPEGKMAMLHEKEIVLNKTDTANLLDSIQLLHSILQTIDLQAANAQFSSLSPGQLFQAANTGDILEQNVHIEAHFDNVRDRDEIVEAFNTLVNRASQYANRKK